MFKPLSEVEAESYEDAFLIADLLTSKMTALTGEPKAGKSLLVVGMLQALLEGHEHFLGQRVHRRLDSVVYGFTDDGADAELRGRLEGTESIARLSVVPMFAASAERWTEVTQALIAERPGLFVLDTVLGALGAGDDIASGVIAQQVIQRVRPISQAGIPVLLVTHTPKGNAEGLTVSSSPIGGRALAGGIRGIVALRKDKHGRRLQTSINRARDDLNLPIYVERQCDESEVPVWSTRSSTVRKPAAEWKQELALAVIADQPEVRTASGIGSIYATRFVKTESTVRQAAGDLLQHDGQRWCLTAA